MVCGSYCMRLWLSFVQCITLGVNAESVMIFLVLLYVACSLTLWVALVPLPSCDKGGLPISCWQHCRALGVNAESMAHGQFHDGSAAAVHGLKAFFKGGACPSSPPVMREGSLLHASSIAVLWV